MMMIDRGAAGAGHGTDDLDLVTTVLPPMPHNTGGAAGVWEPAVAGGLDRERHNHQRLRARAATR
jgi:hypothetical protein